jgi:dsDNA-specific endonuclease/ATPase MutS2
MSDITNQTGYTEFPIDGTLDLHIFRPEDVKDLVPDYIDECRSRGILNVKIIHGKGTGVLRSIVHSILAGLPEVVEFSCGGSS